MPGTDLEQAVAIAERIREALAACHVQPLPDLFTASFAVAELAVGQPGNALLRHADSALYGAKQLGRNRVVAA